MTALQWFIEQLEERGHIIPDHIEETSLIMEKQQMQDFGAKCCLMTKQKNEWTLEQLYNETYGSKGSETKQ